MKTPESINRLVGLSDQDEMWVRDAFVKLLHNDKIYRVVACLGSGHFANDIAYLDGDCVDFIVGLARQQLALIAIKTYENSEKGPQ